MEARTRVVLDGVECDVELVELDELNGVKNRLERFGGVTSRAQKPKRQSFVVAHIENEANDGRVMNHGILFVREVDLLDLGRRFDARTTKDRAEASVGYSCQRDLPRCHQTIEMDLEHYTVVGDDLNVPVLVICVHRGRRRVGSVARPGCQFMQRILSRT